MNQQLRPPYFEPIIEGLRNQDAGTQAAFGRHVHWGYWADTAQANGSPMRFGDAAEELCKVFCDCAEVNNGMNILDVGCGFGGTIASLNERFSNLQLTGINIDPAQLARANELVKPRNTNGIEFILANANNIPCPNRSFDHVLAVESIFHFDRQQFFSEAERLLVAGGKLTISDFLISEQALQYVNGFDLFGQQEIRKPYGEVDLSFTMARYRQLAEANGLALRESLDITQQTLPTYDFLLSDHNGMPPSWHNPSFIKATRMLQKASRQGLMSYQILVFTHTDAKSNDRPL